MTLFELVTAISLFTPVALGVMVGWNEGRLVGLLLGVSVGAVLGIGNVCGIRTTAMMTTRRFIRDEDTLFAFTLGCIFYLAMLAWIIASSFGFAKLLASVLSAFAAKG